MKRYTVLIALLLAACSTRPNTALAALQAIPPQDIKDYLVEKIGATSCGGKVFSAYQVMGAEQDQQTTKLYLWAFVQEYCRGQDSLTAGTGSSLPVVIFIEQHGGTYQIVAYRDAGEGYQDLKKNFPLSVRPSINLPPDQYNQRASSLATQTRQEAEAYYGVQK